MAVLPHEFCQIVNTCHQKSSGQNRDVVIWRAATLPSPASQTLFKPSVGTTSGRFDTAILGRSLVHELGGSRAYLRQVKWQRSGWRDRRESPLPSMLDVRPTFLPEWYLFIPSKFIAVFCPTTDRRIPPLEGR